MAIYIATHGPRQQNHVQRAKELMLSCMWSFTMLESEGFISSVMVREAERRLEPILAAIDQLATTPVEDWLSLEMPTIAESEGFDQPPTPLQEIMERVEAGLDVPGLHMTPGTDACAPRILRWKKKRKRRRGRKRKRA